MLELGLISTNAVELLLTDNTLLLEEELELTLANTLELLLVDATLLLSEVTLDATLELLLDIELELPGSDAACEDGAGPELPPPPPHAVKTTEAIAVTKRDEGYFFI